MMDLLPEDEALLARARQGLEPRMEDHARNKHALLVKIAAGAVAAATLSTATEAAATTSLASTATSAGVVSVAMKFVGIGVLSAAILGGGLVAVRKGNDSSTRRVELAPVNIEGVPARARSETVEPTPLPSVVGAPAVRPLDEQVAHSSPIEAPKKGPSSGPIQSDPAVPSERLPSRAVAPIADPPGLSPVELETDLLARADEALKAGDPYRALELVNRHAESFPGGVLVEEREAERIVVLCALGRTREAEALGAAFLRDRPRSPLASRVRGSCGTR